VTSPSPRHAGAHPVRSTKRYVIPFAAQVQAVRGVADGLPITDFLRESAIAVVWLGLAFALAANR
jgi:hypothetical protein